MPTGRSDSTLVALVSVALASATARAAEHLACRPGCSQCCVGIFPIAQQDAARLREGLAELQATDAARAARIRARVAHSVARLAPYFPGDLTSGVLDAAYESSPLFCDEVLQETGESLGDSEPCPVLDPETGTCDLYQARPITCRTFGPPMQTPGDDGEVNLATCELCFTHATTEQIAACQLDPTLPAQEAASNEAFNAANGVHGETLVAFALR
ncbi:MAG: YkgJ family cysteine cluster protein [Acidobacteriota bacterium]|nr:YkgJ family cysteine cluster protein [Acidobacteriota bacterium]